MAKKEIFIDKDFLHKKYILEELSLAQISKLLGWSIATIHRNLKFHKIKVRSISQARKIWSKNNPNSFKRKKHTEEAKKKMRGRTGEKSHMWKGGRVSIPQGYVYIYEPRHPNCNKGGYVFEHRLVMEKQLSRYLKEHEKVHHINGRKDDNRPGNLALTNIKKHKTSYLEGYKQGLAFGLLLSVMASKHGGK